MRAKRSSALFGFAAVAMVIAASGCNSKGGSEKVESAAVAKPIESTVSPAKVSPISMTKPATEKADVKTAPAKGKGKVTKMDSSANPDPSMFKAFKESFDSHAIRTVKPKLGMPDSSAPTRVLGEQFKGEKVADPLKDAFHPGTP